MAGIPGDLLKEATAAGKAATKGSERSYMGQLHSGITKAGESMGMSNNVSKYVAGLGMAGAGIGAFNLANGTSENHPFVGGAMKVGMIAGAGYAALKGHGAKAVGEAASQLAFDFGKEAEATVGKKAEAATSSGVAHGATSASAATGQTGFDFSAPSNASGVSAAAGTVEKSSAGLGAAAPSAKKPTHVQGAFDLDVAPQAANPHGVQYASGSQSAFDFGSAYADKPTHGVASASGGGQGSFDFGASNPKNPAHAQSAFDFDAPASAGTTSVGSSVGERLGGGNTLVSESSDVARNPNARRPARRDKKLRR